MKKLLVLALFGAYAGAQEVTPTAAPSSHSIFYQGDFGYQLNGKQWEGEHLFKYTYKFAGGYALEPVLSFWTNYDKQDSGDWNVKTPHQFLQLRWSTPKMWDIAGFKTNFQARYGVPTGNSAQLAGSYGSVSGRLIMEQEFNSYFNLTIIPKLAVYVQRNGNAVRDGAKQDRNDLVSAILEIAPQFKFSEDLTLTFDFEFAGTYRGDGSDGSHNLLVVPEFAQEVELMYNVKSLGDLGVGAFVNNGLGNEFGNHTGLKFDDLLKGDNLWTGLRIGKKFDL